MFVYNGFWNVVVTPPILGWVKACVDIGGLKLGGKPCMGIVLIAIILTLLRAWVVIAYWVANTWVRTSSKGWVLARECSPSLFLSSLKEFLDDGVFYHAMLDTRHNSTSSQNHALIKQKFSFFDTFLFQVPPGCANLFTGFLVEETNKSTILNLLHESQFGEWKRFLW